LLWQNATSEREREGLVLPLLRWGRLGDHNGAARTESPYLSKLQVAIQMPKTLTLLYRLSTCALLAAVTSCGSDSTGTGNRVVASVIVSGTRSNVAVGKTLQLTAVGLDANGFPVTGAIFQWSSSNPSIASVSNTGVVTGVALGSATITALTGTIAGSLDITVGPVMTTEITQDPINRG